ncbi:MAG: hypothetical protein ACI83Y_000645, partial [Candidatus Azotimanducaceae bacterium]
FVIKGEFIWPTPREKTFMLRQRQRLDFLEYFSVFLPTLRPAALT